MKRPMPRPTAETRPFWEGCAEGRLRYQRCRCCGAVQPIPRSLCGGCQSTDLGWHDASGVGTVLSFTEVFRAPTPAFAADAPYLILIVDMEEGFRLMVNGDSTRLPGLAIGARVRIGFRAIDGVMLPYAEQTV